MTRASPFLPLAILPHLPQAPVRDIIRQVKTGQLTRQEGHERIRALRR